MIFHPLNTLKVKPLVMNNPFYYQPDDLCKEVQREIVSYLETKADWRDEISAGKMFGFLIVERNDGAIGYLAAFSGQILGSEKHDYFVPPVFDYLQETGHFKTKEREIETLNRQIADLEKPPVIDEETSENINKISQEIVEFKKVMEISKANRDRLRLNPDITDDELKSLIAESQFQKAELKRLKKRYEVENQRILEVNTKRNAEIQRLKELRKQMSAELQNYLFSNFVMLNALGEQRNLLDIFNDYNGTIPPSGSGECCAPKLLQYAYSQHYKPLQIAEFWWGASPVGELRRHLDFYPACRGKCKPILDFMLRGLRIADNPLEMSVTQDFETIFEDDYIAVINKPAGMLSVQGKSNRISAAEIAKKRFGASSMVVHRLDMATSGLIVIAKNLEIYKNLQRQFLDHKVRKVYYAILQGVVKNSEGKISLPLIADIHDRPRQKVDYKHGKPAETLYKVDKIIDGKTFIHLYPTTGRTHQLRVHCAYLHGLHCPIVGDELYGSKSDRMYLHAESITLTHPVTGKEMCFEAKSGF